LLLFVAFASCTNCILPYKTQFQLKDKRNEFNDNEKQTTTTMKTPAKPTDCKETKASSED